MQLKRVTGAQRPYRGHYATYLIEAPHSATEDNVRQYVATELGCIAYAKDASWYGNRIMDCRKLDEQNDKTITAWQVNTHEPYTD
jgi:hypothetical protein